MFCKYCGNKIADDKKFCPYCGKEVKKIEDLNRTQVGLYNPEPEQPEKKYNENVFEETRIETTDHVEIPAPQEEEKTTPYNTSQFTTNNYFTDETSDINRIDISTDSPAPTPISLPTTKKNIMPLIVAGVVAVLALVLIYLLFFSRKYIKPESFVTVNVDDRLSGYANAEVIVDYNKLSAEIGEKKLKKLFKAIYGDQIQYIESTYQGRIDDILNSQFGYEMINAGNLIYHTVENTSNLSNGSEITVVFDSRNSTYMPFEEALKKAGLKMDKDYKYVVSGLEEGKAISIASPSLQESLSFSGVEGNGSVVFDWKNNKYMIENLYSVSMENDKGTVTRDNSLVGTLYYDVVTENGESVQGKLKEGDTVYVRVVPDEYLSNDLIDNKFSLNDEKIKVTVGKLGSYGDAKNLDTQQLIDLSEKFVSVIRNMGSEPQAHLEGIYQGSNGNKKTINYAVSKGPYDYYILSAELYQSADGKTFSTSDNIENYYLGSSKDDINRYLQSAYTEYEEIDSSAVKEHKYSVGKEGIVIVEGLRVRSGPGVYYDHVKINGSLANFSANEVVKIVDEAKDSDGDLWYYVEFERNGQTYTYWGSATYILTEKNGF